MPRYNYICGDSHITEIECPISEIPDSIECPQPNCFKDAKRYYGGMGIYTTAIEGGTGGGVKMEQKKNEN